MPSRTPKELQGDIQRAVQILQLFTDPNKGKDLSMLIPSSVLANAHGIVFIRLFRVGLGLSAKTGNGIIIARLPNGSWSAPSGVSMVSLGVGQMFGAESIDMILVMNYRAAVKAFLDGGGQLQLGVGASISAGPIGRSADISASASMTGNHVAATYAYSSSKGLYLGYQFEGSKVSERVRTNQAYYGRPITAHEILTGVVPPPQDAAQLYDALNALGAGPRPGASFGPRKSVLGKQSSHTSASLPTQSSPQPPQPQPPQPQPPRPLPKDEKYMDPPPPYEANPSMPPHSFDNQASVFPPDTKRPVMQTGYSRQSINQAAVNIHQTGHSQGAGPSHFYSPHEQNNAAPSSPVMFIPPLHQSKDTKSHQDIKPAMPPPADSMTVVVAKYDYHSDAPTDLSFSAGDHIIVTKRLEDRNSWWEGEIGTKKGYFPANYTEDITD